MEVYFLLLSKPKLSSATSVLCHPHPVPPTSWGLSQETGVPCLLGQPVNRARPGKEALWRPVLTALSPRNAARQARQSVVWSQIWFKAWLRHVTAAWP